MDLGLGSLGGAAGLDAAAAGLVGTTILYTQEGKTPTSLFSIWHAVNAFFSPFNLMLMVKHLSYRYI